MVFLYFSSLLSKNIQISKYYKTHLLSTHNWHSPPYSTVDCPDVFIGSLVGWKENSVIIEPGAGTWILDTAPVWIAAWAGWRIPAWAASGSCSGRSSSAPWSALHRGQRSASHPALAWSQTWQQDEDEEDNEDQFDRARDVTREGAASLEHAT